MISQAEEAGVLTAAEAEQLRALDEQVMELIAVDDFDGQGTGHPSRRHPGERSPAAPGGRNPLPSPNTDTVG